MLARSIKRNWNEQDEYFVSDVCMCLWFGVCFFVCVGFWVIVESCSIDLYLFSSGLAFVFIAPLHRTAQFLLPDDRHRVHTQAAVRVLFLSSFFVRVTRIRYYQPSHLSSLSHLNTTFFSHWIGVRCLRSSSSSTLFVSCELPVELLRSFPTRLSCYFIVIGTNRLNCVSSRLAVDAKQCTLISHCSLLIRTRSHSFQSLTSHRLFGQRQPVHFNISPPNRC